MLTVSEQLRRFMEESGKSRYLIAKESGVSSSMLSRFANGKAALSSRAMDKLCRYLDLELRKRSPQN